MRHAPRLAASPSRCQVRYRQTCSNASECMHSCADCRHWLRHAGIARLAEKRRRANPQKNAEDTRPRSVALQPSSLAMGMTATLMFTWRPWRVRRGQAAAATLHKRDVGVSSAESCAPPCKLSCNEEGNVSPRARRVCRPEDQEVEQAVGLRTVDSVGQCADRPACAAEGGAAQRGTRVPHTRSHCKRRAQARGAPCPCCTARTRAPSYPRRASGAGSAAAGPLGPRHRRCCSCLRRRPLARPTRRRWSCSLRRRRCRAARSPLRPPPRSAPRISWPPGRRLAAACWARCCSGARGRRAAAAGPPARARPGAAPLRGTCRRCRPACAAGWRC